VLVGTWRSRDDWEAWHNDPAFLEQRARLESLDARQEGPSWYDVVAHAQAGSA
jgi:heme-degrading monooxygenase HmoA